ncbi:hypothetical protein L9F63_012575 [Diploptera punctata]|uniref:Regulatory protein zeste n=1 Tax=Diploptera punctata TaxID=6984 RepID=A0AAD8ENU1_DIPPU|nr:hypothetical protein L9F63_012575 [Diploptera punctata]
MHFQALLKELATEEISIIECKLTDTSTNSKKKRSWDKIHRRFCELSKRERSLKEIKQQWRCLKLQAKKSLSDHKLAIYKTGGGPKTISPPEEFTELIPLEFVEDHNEYDSNGIATTDFSTESPNHEINEEKVVEILPSMSDQNLSTEMKNRKRETTVSDEYKETITRLAEQRYAELLKQKETEHNKRMENMELERK